VHPPEPVLGQIGVRAVERAHLPPGLVDDLVAPALARLGLVRGVLEPVEHRLRGHVLPSFDALDGVLDRADQAGEPAALALQPVAVLPEHRDLAADPGQRLADRRQAHAQLAQQQDPLQPQQLPAAVVPPTVVGDPGRRQQPDRVVVPQRPGRHPGHPRHLDDRPAPVPHENDRRS
jgi:hypothetical protein